MVYKQKNLFFTVLEAEKFKIKVPAIPVSGESPLPGSQMAGFLFCDLTWWKVEALVWVLSDRGSSPTHKGSALHA